MNWKQMQKMTQNQKELFYDECEKFNDGDTL